MSYWNFLPPQATLQQHLHAHGSSKLTQQGWWVGRKGHVILKWVQAWSLPQLRLEAKRMTAFNS